MFNGNGKIIYRDSSCICLVDQQIVDYYYSLIPKYKEKNRQKYPAHITIIRKWEKYHTKIYESKYIPFTYSPFVHENEIYYYLNCWSEEIKKIREINELRPYRVNNCYHITIGNKKCQPNKSS